MKSATLKSAAVLLTLIFSLGTVQAKGLIDATDPAKILEIAKGFGSASLEKDDGGDPRITGRIDGNKYGISFWGCTDGKDCEDIQFNAGWSDTGATQEQMNEWNRTKRFGKAFLDSDGDPNLEMGVNINHGVSTENMEDTFKWWSSLLEGFKASLSEK